MIIHVYMSYICLQRISLDQHIVTDHEPNCHNVQHNMFTASHKCPVTGVKIVSAVPVHISTSVTVTHLDIFKDSLWWFPPEFANQKMIFVIRSPSAFMFVATKTGNLDRTWIFLNPNQVVLVPEPNQSMTSVKRKCTCGFAETHFPTLILASLTGVRHSMTSCLPTFTETFIPTV